MRVFVAFLLLLPGISLASSPFPDVSDTHENRSAIESLGLENVIQGYPDGTYRPESLINRAEFLKILIEANREILLGIDGPSGETVPWEDRNCESISSPGSRSIQDIQFGSWYAGYVCYALNRSIVSGYPDNTFRPAANINFVEAAKMAAETFNLGNTQPLPANTGGPWYERYVRFLSDRNAIPTSIRSFDQLITRGEMAEMIWRLRNDITSEPSTSYETLKQSTAAAEVFGKIASWTPSISWSAPAATTEDLGFLTSPSTVSGRGISAPNLGLSTYRNSLHQRLVQNGWMPEMNLDADGVAGSRWGYRKDEDDFTRYLVLLELSTDCVGRGDGLPGVTCSTHESSVFVSDPLTPDHLNAQ